MGKRASQKISSVLIGLLVILVSEAFTNNSIIFPNTLCAPGTPTFSVWANVATRDQYLQDAILTADKEHRITDIKKVRD